MRKTITHILAAIALLSVSANTIRAQELTMSGSATLRFSGKKEPYDYRVLKLKTFLERFESPLTVYAQDFVSYADKNGLDYRLVASISGVESTFGKRIPKNSYNAYGWVNGNYSFESWPDSIQIVSETLKTRYIDRGAVTIPQIAKRYAPPSTTWGTKVKYFVGKIDTLPLSFDI